MQGLDLPAGLLDRGEVTVDHFDAQLGGVAFQPSDEFGVLDMITHGGVHHRPRAIGAPRKDLAGGHERGDRIGIGQGPSAGEANREPGGLQLLPQGAREGVVIVFLAPQEFDAELERGLDRPIKFSGRDI